MRRWLLWTFAADTIVGVLLGLPLFLAPGQFLGLFGWAPIDPIMSRLTGAAVLATAWASYRCWGMIRYSNREGASPLNWTAIQVVLEIDIALTILGVAGLLRHLVFGTWPWYAWTLFAGLAAFAIAFIVGYVGRPRE
jgi:hypothetical protein